MDQTAPTGDRARLIRRFNFQARHRYARPEWDAEANRRHFGDQSESHEHAWTVEVEVVGPIDPATGWVVDLALLDRAAARVMAGWDGGDLNDLIPPVRQGTMQPSTEELARWLHLELAPALRWPARLERVRVWESEALGAAFPP